MTRLARWGQRAYRGLSDCGQDARGSRSRDACGPGGTGRIAAADFEDPVHVFDEKMLFVIGQVPLGIELLKFGGSGL